MKRPVVGDWIRFRKDGALVIGVVQYVCDARFSHQGEWKAVTDAGDVDETSALELRRA